MKKLKKPPLLTACVIACLISSPALPAEQAPRDVDNIPSFAEDALTGDWGGIRRAMWARGLELELGYKTDLLRNLRGGIEKGGRPMSHVDVKLGADFEKLANWRGGTGYLNFIQDYGGKINARQVGSLTGVSNIEVASNTHRLFHAWLQQEFADGRGALLIGLYPIDSEFQILDAASVFVQPPYGASADISLTRGPSIFNASSFGFRGKWTSIDRSAYVQAAVLDGIPGDPDQPRGTHIQFNKGDGAMSIVEIGVKPVAADVPQPQAGEEAPQRIEKYAAGLWGYSARVADQLDTRPDGSVIWRRSWGWYALAERTLLQRGGDSDLAGFARLGGSDGNSTPIKRTVNIGVRLTAPLAGRGDDVFGLAYTRAALSDKWRRLQLTAGIQTAAAEDAWEATYRIQFRKWLALQPLVQRIYHPGGDRSRAAANIVGARIEITL